jgi:DNA-binding CsgD family transcriptional regulator
MNQLPLTFRIVTDTATITAFVMVALFCLFDGLGRDRADRDPLLAHFALLSLSFALYVFFDNSLSLLVFDPRVAAGINTVGVAACSFLQLVSFLLLTTRVLGIPRERRLWMRVCVPPALVALSLSPLALVRGWEWYMAHCDPVAVSLYVFTFVFGMGNALRVFFREGLWRNRSVLALFAVSNVMIASLFFWRVLIMIDQANFLLNNSIVVGLTALVFFPVFLASRRSAEYREFRKLKDEVEAKKSRAREGLHATFLAAKELARKPGRRELEVCESLLAGLEYKEIADALGLSLSGVKKRAHSLYEKLGVQNRTELYNRVIALRGGEALPGTASRGALKSPDGDRPQDREGDDEGEI